jgi:glucan phosphoethanolaminetransferase (alkaline phosphatase superfamily)
MMLRTIGPIELAIILLVGILPAIAFWKIFAKAGYPGALGLLALLPLVNLIMFFFLAFSDWPVLKELKTLRHNSPPSM